MGIKIGVLALQGNVSEHICAFKSALDSCGISEGSEVFELRQAEDIESCDAIAIPGGESTTISRLIDKNGMRIALKNFKGAFFATCAGMVILASSVDDVRVNPLGVIDISVGRNAFGRQKDSFEVPVDIKGLNSSFNAVFIRAPVVKSAGEGVEILANCGDEIVAVKEKKHMAFSFHPEIAGDFRIHKLFLRNSGIIP
ncbi:pyridoxal 5'-phosphate synthase glutaminase subunit PdxT [Methanomicrobium antiquum]|uniref:Pyridoxal 5'-phosphate synthase subunit PdxT n=1 Tax=Methanomicrobium antiquum TaxID=487686 RepID=A0AAF0FQV8_9EURY|nr:pyridoxal 5'-phosphate synthase glutaminase subunit PdxT [Methanomicrobium antiquum]WFN36171.1 pyridoxal 5'-phosphate synthase glutaminase subunit PdxT [Methanomicrobium antiquum]